MTAQTALSRFLYTPTLLLLFVLTGIGCQSAADKKGDVNPEKLLERVEQQYENLQQYRFKAQVISNIKAGGRTQNSEVPITYASDGPGRIYLYVDQQQPMKVVSNGSKTWTYMPDLNQYTVEQAAQLEPTGEQGQQQQSQTQGLIQLAEQLIAQYATITDRMTKAVHVKDSVLTLEQGERPVYVIEATYDAKVQSANFEMEPQRYYIDKDTELVLRQVNHASMDDPNGQGRVSMKQMIDISSAELEPQFAANTFDFSPPSGAQQVEQFQAPQGPSGLENQQSPLVGETAYNFDLTNLEGKSVSLDEFRGKIVLIDFWATWCAPCREAHPHIQDIYDEYKDDGLVVLGVNNESKKKAAQYMEENNYTFPTLLDLDRKVQARYQVSAIPNVFIINREGDVAANLIGYRTKDQVVSALKEAGL
jgi:peroxiredoxin/outer membrane lipoprotein-sorting protein